MARIVQPKKDKGSQRWLQKLANRQPELLNDTLRCQLGLTDRKMITWLSPRESDDFAEYRDQEFLECLGISLEYRSLASFWPSNGPQWDALGKTSCGDLLIVEAKAHTPELESPPCGACPSSLALIQQSLREAGQHFKAETTIGWSKVYYQYANRLAHLYFLRELNRLPAWLIFLYFVKAEDVAGPKSAEEWRPAIETMHTHLGVTPSQLGPYVIDVFVDVTEMSKARKVHQW